MKNNSPYLDIYKNKWKIVFQLWKDIFINKKSKKFFKYLDFLKKQEINFVLLDEEAKQIFNSDWNNYFLDNEKNNISENINNILILEENSEIKDIENKKIEFISSEKLKLILSLNHNKIKIDKNSNIFRKLQEIDKLLDNWTYKVTLTNLEWVKEELEWFGSGTMFVNLEKAKFKKLDNYNLFKQIYKTQILEKNWKEKDEEKLKIISSDYNVLDLEWTILWWYYLWNFEIELDWKLIKWKLLENLFSSKSGWWIWEILWKEIKKENIIFAYSKKEDFFTKIWFKKIKWEKSETWADLWMYENFK